MTLFNCPSLKNKGATLPQSKKRSHKNRESPHSIMISSGNPNKVHWQIGLSLIHILNYKLSQTKEP